MYCRWHICNSCNAGWILTPDVDMMAGTYQYSKGYDKWETPADVYDDFCKKHNVKPVLDVCAEKLTTKCKSYFATKALERSWNKDFFVNPPYSEDAKWIEKAYCEHKKHNVTGVALVFAKVDVKWWHEYVEDIAEVHNHRGRISFYKDGHKLSPAPRPSSWIIWRKEELH